MTGFALSRGFSLSGGLSGMGGVALPLPFQVIGSRGEISALVGSAVISSNVLETHRRRQYFGNRDCSSLKLAFGAWYVDAAGEINAPNNVTLSAAVELNGVTVRCQFEGANSITLASGAAIVLTDELTPEDFGLSVFPANGEHWLRIEREVALGGRFIYHAGAEYTNAIAGEGCIVAATGTASQLTNTGALAASGGWAVASNIYLPVATIGRPVAPMMAVGILGASIENGVSDDNGDGLNDGGGYLRRSLHFVRGEKLARCSLAKSGEAAVTFVASHAKREAYLQYFTHILCGHGGNDYSTGETVGNTLSRIATIWELAKNAGAGHVAQIKLAPKTDGDWSQVGTQTPRTGYETGGAWRDFAHTSIDASISSNANLDGTFDILSAQADATSLDRWQPNMTPDGTHHNKRASGYVSQKAIEVFEALHVAYRGAYAATPGHAATATLLASLAVQPSAARQAAINEFIYLLDLCGAWSLADIVQVYEAHTQQCALRNWKNPGTFDASLVGTAVWTEDAGIASVTGGNYISSGFNPSTAAGNFAQNSANFMFSIIGGGVANAASLAGFFDGSKGVTCAPCTGTQISSRINEASAVLNSNTFPSGLFALDRSASNVSRVFREGATLAQNTAASAALANGALRLGSISGTSSQARTFGMCLAGASLTPFQHMAVAAAYRRLRAAIAAS